MNFNNSQKELELSISKQKFLGSSTSCTEILVTNEYITYLVYLQIGQAILEKKNAYAFYIIV